MDMPFKWWKLVLIIAFIALSKTGIAQSNFYRTGFALGAGINRAYVDVREFKIKASYVAKGFYYFTENITGDLEAQFGRIEGGNVLNNDHNRQFLNQYMQFTVNGKVYAGIFSGSYNDTFFLLRGLNAGIGLGVIVNKMKYVVRIKPNSGGYVFPGEDKGVNLSIPLNVGYDVHLSNADDISRVVLNFNFQHNVTIGEGMDGYDDPSKKFRNKNPDQLSVLSASLKFNFGIAAYRGR